jgi:hypothetical protein
VEGNEAGNGKKKEEHDETLPGSEVNGIALTGIENVGDVNGDDDILPVLL